MSFLSKIIGDFSSRELKKIEKIVDKVESYDLKMQSLSDEELKGKTQEFKNRLSAGETLDDLLPEAFAVCREASVRSLGMKPFRVQLVGGVAIHQGRIAEMKTGEGKTLVATLPAYLNALEGKGVHLVTVNDYLAKRDAEWMGKLYSFLGLSVGCVIHGVNGIKRREAYLADITYGTNNEFGFDYLRDNMVVYREKLVQRDLNFAIIDEVDSILIDEARTPLIISGKGDTSTDLYAKADKFVRTLKKSSPLEDKNDIPDGDFTVEEKDKQIALTDSGVEKAEGFFGVENFGDPENMEINHHVLQALKANNMMERDVDYIVKDGEIVIVDEFTGRLMFGRRFNNGLHQAIEAKEKVSVREESKTLATITLQNYFRMYSKLAGMTGTAKTEEEEFREIYNMDVVVIPTNKPIIRDDMSDSIYNTENAKFRALADKIEAVNKTGQPILVGTITIEKSEKLSDMLKKRGIKHNVLNAKQHEKEAEIIAEAGRLNQVTIATNMAGRGTDIILGGNPEFEAKKQMEKLGYTAEQIAFATGFEKSDEQALNDSREKFNQIRDDFKRDRDSEHDAVVSLGGLYILGSERHESRRIDNQLRGRAGRQGDPGATQFFLSLEDDLMRLFGGERTQNIMAKVGVDDDVPIETGILTRMIEGAQKKVEGRNFGIRKYVLQYDNVMNKQREIIYAERRKVLFGENVKDDIMHMKDVLVDSMVESTVADSRFAEEWDIEGLHAEVKNFIPTYSIPEMKEDDELRSLTAESLATDIKSRLEKLYKEKEEEIGAERMRELERVILLRVVDNLWMEHIDAMDQMKSGIGLRALGQQDPAAEYAKEGFDMFEQLEGAIQEDTVKFCYAVRVETHTERKEVASSSKASKSEFRDELKTKKAKMQGGPKQRKNDANRPHKQETVRRELPKIGRNDACHCGSGKKYKNCCMRADMEKANEGNSQE